ncbi:hypothetical protein RclHR1_11160003 [Rhizophagus clarus]|uniref:Uncharacterized protein LOC105314062 n=1 Tax=Rhizophagus clarus TaxID=94130 RepID=A0A2Z6Q3T6_9GLOM|nr:hypothetical protein RclHR1_11160003 [Rhizophagus clarus]GET01847.1 uncharacterized protein LOC105314062 [Rhizophagus clarus]
MKAFQKLLIHTVGERDFLAQETCHLLLQISLYHSSQNFVNLNLNKEASRLLHDSGNDINNENNGIKKTDPSPLQRYCNRPTELNGLSLFRDLLNLTENYTLSWINFNNRHLSEINADLPDLIVDNVEEINDDDSDDPEEDATQETYEPRLDWMVLPEIKPSRPNLPEFSRS